MSDKVEEKEVWKVYPDYPWIEASNLGRIRTIDRYVPYRGSKRLIKGRILKQHLRPDGYMEVGFGAGGKSVHLLVHRIVAICFIPNPDNSPEVNHKDNDKTNNSVSNLEWCSRKYNEDYKKNFGTESNRPVIAINQETFEVLWFESQSEAGRNLGADSSTISKVVRGKLNKTGGCWFCNADENAVKKTKDKFGDKIARKVEKLMIQNQN